MCRKKRTVCLQSYITADEYGQIVDISQQCGLSVSELTRRVLLGQEISSKIDRQAFIDLLHVRADLGRLGGLLKLWLSDDTKAKGYTSNVRSVLHEIEARQAEMKPLIERLWNFI